MTERAAGLSNALRDLAEHDTTPPAAPDGLDPAAHADIIQAQIDEDPTGRPAVPRTGAGPTARARNRQFFNTVAPPLLSIMSVALLIPAVWSTLVLFGFEVWNSDRPDARSKGIGFFLATWPVALGLLSGAAYFYWQKKRSNE